MIKKSVPPKFRDADCCLTCVHSEVDCRRHPLDVAFLNCTKFNTVCEDTTTCDDYELKKEEGK